MEADRVPETVHIVVPFGAWHDWVLECLDHCKRLDYPNVKIWLLPDELPSDAWRARLDEIGLGDRVVIEPTNGGNPSVKRNHALRHCEGGLVALIDSDAYPRHDWLTRAVPLLEGDVAIVAGPNLTPEGDPVLRRACGRVMASPLGFGAAFIRHVPVPRMEVREMPTCNMVMRHLPGLYFNEALDTGEDLSYCVEVRARGRKILYDPEVVVYHHRRSLFVPFIRQFYAYGLFKWYLLKTHVETGHVWQSFPALLFLYLVGLPVLLAAAPGPGWRWMALAPLAMYLGVILVETARCVKHVSEYLPTAAGFLLGHLSYGAGSVVGLFRRPKPVG